MDLTQAIDANKIYTNLYQGGWPAPGEGLALLGVSTMVLCAHEFQPPYVLPEGMESYQALVEEQPYPGVQVVYAPNHDSVSRPPTRDELSVALKAAHMVADALRAGKTVLVTCWQGRNRSGLVSAIALHLLTGMPGSDAVALIQANRPRALTNPRFVEVLSRIQRRAA